MSVYNNSNVLVAGGTSTFVQQGVSEFRALVDHIAANALHNSGEVSDQPKCHPGTRVAIMDRLYSWAAALTYLYPMLWLHGPAGTGKSAILRTIAQRLSEEGLLLASFFFFRASAGRNSTKNFIATIAYQVALAVPATRHHIEEALQRNPVIFSLSLWDQARALIASPIIAASCDPSFELGRYPPVIIIDGLDECDDPDKQCEILDVLLRIGRILQNVPIPFAILVASRPEHHIRAGFDIGDLNKSSSRLALDASYEPDADIRKFLIDKFEAIRQNPVMKSCLPPDAPWPSPEVVETLVAKASGQFIHVATVAKFVSSPRHNPVKRLDVILGTLSAGSLKPFEQLDNLYSTIFSTISEEDLTSTLRVLGVLLVPYKDVWHLNARSPPFLEKYLELDSGDVRRLFFDLESLLTVAGNHEDIQFYHASLSDYLFDRSRSGKFWIDIGMVYADLSEHGIHHLLDWPGIRPFFTENCKDFLSNATPTAELRNNINNFNWGKGSSVGAAGYSGLRDICPTILQTITQNSKFSSATTLFAAPLRIFKQIIAEKCRIYVKNIGLKAFLVTSIALFPSSTGFTHNHRMFGEYLLSPKDVEADCKYGFNILSTSEAPPVIQFIRDYLDDKEGECFFDERQYTEVAVYLFTRGMFPSVAWVDSECLFQAWWKEVMNDHAHNFLRKSSDNRHLIQCVNSIVSNLQLRDRISQQTLGAMESYLEGTMGKQPLSTKG